MYRKLLLTVTIILPVINTNNTDQNYLELQTIKISSKVNF